MIQRVQSVYLLLGGILSIAIVFAVFFKVSDGSEFALIGPIGIQEGALAPQYVTPFPVIVLSVVAAGLQLFALFMFKNRPLQMRLTRLTSLFVIIMILWIGYMFFDLSQSNLEIVILPGLFHPILVVFANFLAIRGIKKDEDLVKSVDRLR